MMKNTTLKTFICLLLMCITCVAITSCSSDDDDNAEDRMFTSLFVTTDNMVNALYDDDFYVPKTKYTSDGNYKVTPIGKLIVVKKTWSNPDVSYYDIKEALTNHYRHNNRVNDVFINNGGTVTIDCRN